jgi:hypothetical protein
MDIRPCLSGDEKQQRASSPTSVEVIHRMSGGGRSSCPMMMNPGAKEAHRSEEYLCKRNRQMAEPTVGYPTTSGQLL